MVTRGRRVLVTGGAGYIGSHTVHRLVEAGWDVTVLDDLSGGHRAALPGDVRLVVGSVGDPRAVAEALDGGPPAGVIHFAGVIEAGLSVTDPGRFWRVNVAEPLVLLDALVAAGCPPVVFSSSAAVYGDPVRVPVAEDDPTRPTSPYGETKLTFERILDHHGTAHGLRSARLRYFNASGAHPSGRIGEDHAPETHLIPLAVACALGRRDTIDIYGTDYPTSDGTAVRDYLHVCDLAEAHLAALEHLVDGGPGGTWNVGLGTGHTVAEVLDAVEAVSGRRLSRRESPRRPGDPAVLVADPTRIRRDLGWEPRWTDLTEIVATAWRWHSTHPRGYGDR